eukprot:gene2566-2605_t
MISFAGGFALAIVDGSRSIAADHLVFLPLRGLLNIASPGLPDRLRPMIEHAGAKLWDPVALFVFDLPAFVIVWCIGALLYLASRRAAPQIGHSNR